MGLVGVHDRHVERWSRVRVLLAALLIYVTAGCGARVAPGQPQGVAERTAPTDVASQPADVTAGGRGMPPDATAQTGAPASSEVAAAMASPPAASWPEDFNTSVRATLSHACVMAGQMQTATIQAASGAGVAAVVGYADNAYHGSMSYGVADDAGRYVWRFPVPLTAPQGWATLLVTATGRGWQPDGSGSSEGSGSAHARFFVARDGACP